MKINGSFVVLFALLCAIPAQAEEIIPDWRGAYIGAHLGVARATDTQTLRTPFGVTESRVDLSGNIAGIHLGKNYQAGRVVFGPIVDVNHVGLDKGGIALDLQVNARMNLGYAVGRNILPYLTAGMTMGHETARPSAPFDGWKKWQSGWIAGAGVNVGLSKNLSVGVLYLHTDLKKDTHLLTVGGAPTGLSVDNRPVADSWLLTLTYKF